MSNAYKAALQRFEDSIRAIERAAVSSNTTATKMSELAQEYDFAKRHLVQKLTYRHRPDCNCRKSDDG